MRNEIPSVVVLKPITPSSESVRSEQLEYKNLQPAVEKHAPYEYDRINEVWDTEEGSVEERVAVEELAKQYMLMGSLALQNAISPESKMLWSKRYTQATSEIYGTPDSDIAQSLENGVESKVSFEQAAEVLRDYLEQKYSPIFDKLEAYISDDALSPEIVADAFEAGLGILADQYDSDWSDWTIERNEEKDSLIVVAGSKKILVGMKRVDMSPEKLKPLFSHEVLVHAQRGLNGAKRDKRLQTGLSGYLDIEEGLGVFHEYALTGDIPIKNVDRYTDIAYALGQIDGTPHTREELLDRVVNRAIERNEQSGGSTSLEDIKKEAYAHVNRIYRGSLGNENIGVFTKDIAYHKGFIEAGNYIQSQIDAGVEIDDIIEFLLQGKFDPTDKAHLDYLNSHQV